MWSSGIKTISEALISGGAEPVSLPSLVGIHAFTSLGWVEVLGLIPQTAAILFQHSQHLQNTQGLLCNEQHPLLPSYMVVYVTFLLQPFQDWLYRPKWKTKQCWSHSRRICRVLFLVSLGQTFCLSSGTKKLANLLI